MELDFTSQLQPALWGLLAGLFVSSAALVVAAGRSEADRFRRYRESSNRWRDLMEQGRRIYDQLLTRTLHLLPRSIQLKLRAHGDS